MAFHFCIFLVMFPHLINFGFFTNKRQYLIAQIDYFLFRIYCFTLLFAHFIIWCGNKFHVKFFYLDFLIILFELLFISLRHFESPLHSRICFALSLNLLKISRAFFSRMGFHIFQLWTLLNYQETEEMLLIPKIIIILRFSSMVRLNIITFDLFFFFFVMFTLDSIFQAHWNLE